ncbi:hypothetical protein [Pendulispora albinea]|uniref:Uncharacterized protein n=1 Tax=Pendulispora albinea TaxID=2741071 RepID=A0ABZ2LRT4_9BACT
MKLLDPERETLLSTLELQHHTIRGIRDLGQTLDCAHRNTATPSHESKKASRVI